MAEDKVTVATNSHAYLTILQKLVELWRRTSVAGALVSPKAAGVIERNAIEN